MFPLFFTSLTDFRCESLPDETNNCQSTSENNVLCMNWEMSIVTMQPRHCNNQSDTSKWSLPMGYLPLTWVSYSAIISFSLRNFAGDVIAVRSGQISGNYLSWVMGRNIGKRGKRFSFCTGARGRSSNRFLQHKLSAGVLLFPEAAQSIRIMSWAVVGFFKWLFCPNAFLKRWKRRLREALIPLGAELDGDDWCGGSKSFSMQRAGTGYHDGHDVAQWVSSV